MLQALGEFKQVPGSVWQRCLDPGRGAQLDPAGSVRGAGGWDPSSAEEPLSLPWGLAAGLCAPL